MMDLFRLFTTIFPADLTSVLQQLSRLSGFAFAVATAVSPSALHPSYLSGFAFATVKLIAKAGGLQTFSNSLIKLAGKKTFFKAIFWASNIFCAPTILYRMPKALTMVNNFLASWNVCTAAAFASDAGPPSSLARPCLVWVLESSDKAFHKFTDCSVNAFLEVSPNNRDFTSLIV